LNYERDFRSWHKADVANTPDVRFAPEAAVGAVEPLAQVAAFTLQLSLSGLTSSVLTKIYAERPKFL
jgi:hypothetical protein